ncbi:MAG: hypothetical protein AB8B93_10735 [Pseudomonadales bacterium]
MRSPIFGIIVAVVLSACGSAPNYPSLLAACTDNGNSNKVCQCAVAKLAANADPDQLQTYVGLMDYSSDWVKTPEGKSSLEKAKQDGPLAQARLIFAIVAEAEKNQGLEPGEGKIIASRLGSMFLTDSVRACQA